MSRNGLGVYSVPAGTVATTLTPLNSAAYNLFLADLTADLNAARPIVAGGTGATTAAAALVNLGLTATAAEINILDGATLTTTELNYVDGVTSAIQAQIDGKQASGATLTSLEGLSLVAGDTIYATAADTLARLAKGTASQVLQINSGATAPEWATPIFSKEFVSTEQTITYSSSLNVAHGLGARPKLFSVVARCISAQSPYAVGDETDLAGYYASGTSFGVTSTADATNVVIRTAASALIYLMDNAGGYITLDTAKWKFVVRAWA